MHAHPKGPKAREAVRKFEACFCTALAHSEFPDSLTQSPGTAPAQPTRERGYLCGAGVVSHGLLE
jgi:hypothetical protein